MKTNAPEGKSYKKKLNFIDALRLAQPNKGKAETESNLKLTTKPTSKPTSIWTGHGPSHPSIPEPQTSPISCQVSQ